MRRGHCRRYRLVSRPKFCIRLQESASQELSKGSNLLVVLPGMLPIGVQARNPGIRCQQRHLPYGFTERARRVLFNHGQKIPVVRQKQGEVERIADPASKHAARFHATRGGKVRAKDFLKGRDLLVEIEEFRSKGMRCRQPLRALDTRAILGPTGLFCVHLRGEEESPAISLYQPGW